MFHDATRPDNPSFRNPSLRDTPNGAEQAGRFVDGSQRLIARMERTSETYCRNVDWFVLWSTIGGISFNM